MLHLICIFFCLYFRIDAISSLIDKQRGSRGLAGGGGGGERWWGGGLEGCMEINGLIKQIDGMKPQKKVKSLICRDRMIPPTTCID